MLHVGVLGVEALELFHGFPFVDDDELAVARGDSVAKIPGLLVGLGHLLEERGLGTEALDGFGDVGNRKRTTTITLMATSFRSNHPSEVVWRGYDTFRAAALPSVAMTVCLSQVHPVHR